MRAAKRRLPLPGGEPLIMSWSGGKDSAGALYELLRSEGHNNVVALLTTVADAYRRVSHHGVREELLDLQAQAIGIPLVKVYLPAGESAPCTNAVYTELMDSALKPFRAEGVRTVAFGDLFLEDLRAWRERNLASAGMRAFFPIWKRDTTSFARWIIATGFTAFLTCVEAPLKGLAGRRFDDALLAALPRGVDPCGENGEFHTYVCDGPIFEHPIAVRAGDIVTRDGREYADLLPAVSAQRTPVGPGAIPPI